MTSRPIALLLVGAGNMGGALLASWARAGVIDRARSAIIDPVPSDRLIALCEERRLALNPVEDVGPYDICVLGVKPQMFPDVLPTLTLPSASSTVFASIAAGVTISTIEDLLKPVAAGAEVIRSMPNLPAAYGEGVTLLTAAPAATAAARDLANRLFAGAGEVVWCADEDELDRLMGISGCGPAFVYLLCEALEEAAIAAGATPDDARRMAAATVRGAATQLANDGRAAAELRAAVTSPGGTTAAALSVLDDPTTGFRELVKRANTAAYDRAKELGA